MNQSTLGAMTEAEARAALEKIRWPNGAECPHCHSKNVTALVKRSPESKTRDGVYKCKDCRQQFSVTVGTVMQGSKIPLRLWMMAFHAICSAKKGISALQLKRQLGLGSYQTAWHLAHRIRFAMTQEPLSGLLQGTVEVDETYVGGKPRNGGQGKRGRGTSKTPVVALVSRDGNVRAHVVPNVTGATLKGAIRENVDRSARIMTDQFVAYKGIGAEFEGGHHTVQHNIGEYARGDVYTNTVESYFSLLKRGVIGSFHHVSKEHLDRYVAEFSFRWQSRKETDENRTIAAIRGAAGKRLTYKPLVGAANWVV